MPTADDLRALARSSPWLWETARFTLHVDRGWSEAPVRAWLRRPDALRVETLDGRLLQAGREVVSSGTTVVLTATGPAADVPTAPPDVLVRRPDGLVASRPGWRWDHDAPFFRDYHWVALLDPLELDAGDPDVAGHGTEVEDVREVEHAGRPAWSAVVRPTEAYEPRCACCPLLPCARSDRLEGLPGARYAEAFTVVLDRGTGICVGTVELGGPRDGLGHTVVLEAVDEPLADHLFRGVTSSGSG